MKQIAIIGGGAAGLMAAIAAAQELRRASADVAGADVTGEHAGAQQSAGECAGAQAAEVVVYEADPERVGRSILATGNGRCNFSNTHIDPSLYRNAEFVQAAYRNVPASQVLKQFSRLGLVWREEAQGRLYPQANKASSVLDVLRAAAQSLGVRFEFGKQATGVEKADGRFHIRFKDSSLAHADAAVLAVGGRAVDKIELPQPLVCAAASPVLGPLEVDDAGKKLTRQLNNIRVRCEVSLKRGGEIVALEAGELLFRDYGVSGVCVFNLSRLAQPGDFVVINFVAGLTGGDKEWLVARFERLRAACPSARFSYADLLRGLLLPQVAQVLLSQFGFKPEDECTQKGVGMMACMLEKFKLQVAGIGDARQCQVWRGGIDVSQFAPETLQSSALPGFFAAGEALDVDAPCGGYNLHWAWASGMAVGVSAAQFATEAKAR